MGNVRHNFVLFKRYLRMVSLSLTEFKSTILSEIVGVLTNLFLWFIFWAIVLESTGFNIEGWGVGLLLVWFGFTQIASTLMRFPSSIWQMDIYVTEIGLEKFIVRPGNILMGIIFGMSQRISGLLNFIIGGMSLVLGLVLYQIQFIELFLLFPAAITSISAIMALSGLYFSVASLTFYFGRIDFLSRLFGELDINFNRVPAHIFPSILFNFLIFVLPIGLIATIPTMIVGQMLFFDNHLVILGVVVGSALLGIFWLYTGGLIFNNLRINHYQGIGG